MHQSSRPVRTAFLAGLITVSMSPYSWASLVLNQQLRLKSLATFNTQIKVRSGKLAGKLCREAHRLCVLAGCLSEDAAHVVAHAHKLTGLILYVTRLAPRDATRVVHHDARVGQGVTLALESKGRG